MRGAKGERGIGKNCIHGTSSWSRNLALTMAFSFGQNIMGRSRRCESMENYRLFRHFSEVYEHAMIPSSGGSRGGSRALSDQIAY